MRPSVTYTPRLTESERRLLALASRLRNLGAFARLVLAPAAERMLRRHWDSKGAAFGHPWAAWAPSTLAARIRKGNVSKGILRDTDHLFLALFRSIFSADRVTTTPTSARLSLGLTDAEDPKFRFLQAGTRFMPARQPVPDPLPRSFRDEVRELFRDFVLTGRARGAGGQFVSLDGVR